MMLLTTQNLVAKCGCLKDAPGWVVPDFNLIGQQEKKLSEMDITDSALLLVIELSQPIISHHCCCLQDVLCVTEHIDDMPQGLPNAT